METQSNIRSNVVLLLLIITIATNLLPSTAVSPVAVTSGEKVSLTLYYEALCPYCENFIVNYLYKIFENGLISIVDLKLSPYGNAKISSNGTIICQHGEWECILNTVEACAIHTWPAVLNLQYADEINALKPPHTYVPWVTVNGQPIYDDYMDFISIICKVYKGSNVPQVCLDLSHPVTAPKDTANHLCYREDNTMSKSTLSKIISSAANSWIYHVGLAESM